MIANYNVELLPYNSTGSFRFWCQKVLPLVYDNSLSYYELLCKVVKYLNDVIQNSDNMNANIEALNQAFIDLQDYVNHYFDEFNMQQYVNAALDEMVDNGTLQDLIEPYLDRLTQTVTDAIEDQNQTIDDAIDAQNQTIDDAIDTQNDRIDSWGDTINVLVGRMDALAQNYGAQDMTLLYDGSANENATNYILSDDINNYDFLDIYYSDMGASHLPEKYVHTRVPVVLNETTALDPIYMRVPLKYTRAGTAQNFNPIPERLYHDDVILSFLNVDSSHVFQVESAREWYWNGSSNSSASSSNTNGLYIKKIYGVQILNDTPNEIIDGRTSYTGVVYPTIGDAIRGQVTALSSQINALTHLESDAGKVYNGYCATNAQDDEKIITLDRSYPQNSASVGDVMIVTFTYESGDHQGLTLSVNNMDDYPTIQGVHFPGGETVAFVLNAQHEWQPIGYETLNRMWELNATQTLRLGQQRLTEQDLQRLLDLLQ